MIVQAFATNHITGGASGWLRQEFRELEILDNITKMRYENILPQEIQGVTRNTLIRVFQQWKGTEYVPEHTHDAIRWTAEKPLKLLDAVTDSPWQNIDKSKKKTDVDKPSKFVKAAGSISVKTSVKHNIDESEHLQQTNQETENVSCRTIFFKYHQ